MKYLIISDIHGAYNNLYNVLNKETFDKIILLGDILPHGPRNNIPMDYKPKEVANLLNNYKDIIIAVKGNCDAEVDEMVLEFPIIELGLIDFIKPIYLTHGHKFNPDKPLNVLEGIVLYGHTHIKKIDKVNDVIYLNPGSIGIPKDDIASYGIMDNEGIKIKDMNNNVLMEVSFEAI